MPSIDTTIIFAGIFGILQVIFTLRVGMYRAKSQINFGDGGDSDLLRRMRAHGNFIESVPIALILLLLNEMNGLSTTWLVGLGSLLLLGRLMHYYAIAFKGPVIMRMLGMICTLLSVLASAVFLLV